MAVMSKATPKPDQQDARGKFEIETIRAALIEAESSGEPKAFDTEAFKCRMQKAHG